MLATIQTQTITFKLCYQNTSNSPSTDPTNPTQTHLPHKRHKYKLQSAIMSKILSTIPPNLLAEYNQYKISSNTLGRLTGFHPAAIRRAIKRPPRPKLPKNKTALIQARKAFRETLAHLPPKQIKELANVSLSTANRIRKIYLEKQKNV